MRYFTDTFKLSVRSDGKIVESLSGVVGAFRARHFDIGPLADGVKGGKFNREVCVNALLVWLSRLDQREQDKVMREAVRLLTAVLEEDVAGNEEEKPEPLIARTVGEQRLDVVEDRREKESRAGGKKPSKGDAVGKDKGSDRKGTPTTRR